jgi:hypothetical protein
MEYYGEDALPGQNPNTERDTYSGFNPNAAAEAASSNLPPGPESWQAGYDTLLRQMGALQSQQDIYKGRSPLSADRHMQNIAKSLAKDYGVNTIGDIGVRYITRPAYEVGSDESRNIIPEEQVPEYFNKTTNQVIPGYKFASEGAGDGYSDYNLRPVPDGKGGTIVLPIQQYSKSGMGAAVEAIQPIMPAINIALMAAGVPPLYMAAGNVGFQAAGGNVDNFGDALRIAAPYLMAAGLQELPELTEAFRSGPAVAGYNSLTDAGQIASNLTGLSGIAANTLGGAAAGGIGSLLAGKDVGQGLLTGGLGGAAASAGQKIFNAATAAGYSKDAANAMSRAATSVIRGLPSGDLENIIANSGLSAAGSYLSSAIAAETGSKFAGNIAALALQSAAGFDPNPSAYITLLQQGRNEALGKREAANNPANTTRTSDAGAATTDPADNTVNTVLAGAEDPLTQLQAADLGTGPRLDTVNVSGTGRAGNEQDLTLSNLSGRSGAADVSNLTAAQIAALTSSQLASVLVTGQRQGLDANAVTDLTSGDLGTKSVPPASLLTSAQLAALTTNQLPGVLVTGQRPALDPNALTDLTSGATVGSLTRKIVPANSSQIAALSTSPVALASNQLATVVVTAQRPGVDPNVITDIITSVTKPTSDLPAATSGPVVLPTSQVTSIVPALTSGLTTLTSGLTTLTSSQITALTSTQIPAATSGSGILTSSQIGALTTTPAMGLTALPTSDARYWRQTGAKGTGGKGGVKFFDWYDTPENRTMAPSVMASTNIPAITSKQAEAIVAPRPKQYFNAATNRYYTDPTGQWTPPAGAGWVQQTFKDGGDVKTNFNDGGYADYGYDWGYGSEDSDVYDYLSSLPADNSWASSPSDYGFNFDLGDLTYGFDEAEAARIAAEADRENVNNIRWDRGDFGDPEDPRNPNYGNEGRAYSGANAIDPVTGSPINAKVGVPNKLRSSTSNPFKQLADAATSNPNLMKALMAAGLGGLLGYMGRPKGITPMGMQGGSLGLSQGQVYGALKGTPVKRAMGGEIDGYAGGGGLHYLKSAEDGMADKIPATIDNKQPAKLSGGEFVIPADVVSHLGNGNSEAGAKRLYEMMDRIRHARTGNKKQGKQINPAKFTPK